MGVHKMRAAVDLTDAGSIADSDAVRAFLTAADGSAITQTGGSLNVNLTNASVAVTATDLDIRDLDFATDSVDVSGSTVGISGSVAVTATDLDIRNLVFATDKVDVSGSAVDVSATDLDIRDLSAASDSVAAWTNDGAGAPIGSINGSLKQVEAYASFAAKAGTVGTSAAQADGTPLANRGKVVVQNLSSRDLYLIADNTGTTATGYQIPPKSEAEFKLTAAAQVWLIGEVAAQPYRFLELAA